MTGLKLLRPIDVQVRVFAQHPSRSYVVEIDYGGHKEPVTIPAGFGVVIWAGAAQQWHVMVNVEDAPLTADVQAELANAIAYAFADRDLPVSTELKAAMQAEDVSRETLDAFGALYDRRGWRTDAYFAAIEPKLREALASPERSEAA